MANFLRYQKLTLLWALFVLVMCGIPTGQLEKMPRFFPGFDKLVHCGFFFVFTALMASGLIRMSGRLYLQHTLGIVLAGVAFGALIEILQYAVFTWRDGDWADLFADSVGVGMAAFCILVTLAATRYAKA